MAILKNIPMQWVKLDPNRPAPAFGDGGPKWEFQAVTKNKAQADEWKAANISVKLIELDGGMAWKASFRKSTTKKDGTPNKPVEVKNGFLQPMDPNTIGNGSVCNVRVFQYEYEVKAENGKGGKKGISTMLMEVQVTKLVEYKAQPGESFDVEQMEVIPIADREGSDDDNDVISETPTIKPATTATPVNVDF
jgi:hypothetical protein